MGGVDAVKDLARGSTIERTGMDSNEVGKKKKRNIRPKICLLVFRRCDE